MRGNRHLFGLKKRIAIQEASIQAKAQVMCQLVRRQRRRASTRAGRGAIAVDGRHFR